MRTRVARCKRETAETFVEVRLNLDGSGQSSIDTGCEFLDHLLASLAQHGLLDLQVVARSKGRDEHHVAEDIAIAIGRALDRALAGRRGIVRFGDATVPMDDALASVALDLGGRSYAVVETKLRRGRIGSLPSTLIRHFLESLAVNAKITLHVSVLRGYDDHHKAEAIFKALGLALKRAVKQEPRLEGRVPSLKGAAD